MLYLALILVLAGLVVIGGIVSKKLTLLANIDLTQIATERQSEVKKRIINQKFKRNFFNFWNKISGFLKPVGVAIAKFFTFLYNKLVNLKEHYEEDHAVSDDKVRRLQILFAEAEDLTHKGEISKAESTYIEIIGLDSHNYRAFQSLGDLYADRGSNHEAEQTLDHAVKLLEAKHRHGKGMELELAKAYFSVGQVASALSDSVKSLANIKKALDLEPNNPRYLDKACEICLNLKDSSGALDYCRKLEKSNPGNKKLKEFKDKIRDLAVGTDKSSISGSVSEANESQENNQQ
ncbi:MAG: hypothetical protein WCO55_03430 [Candidatus Falkowbacteria bacterium]